MKKQKKIGLKDIAEKAGVSVATVSYVLSEGKGGRVGAEMTKKIKRIANDLNYQPNRIAQSLKSGKTYTIGLIVADISNPFFSSIARFVEDRASKFDYTVIFGSSDEKSEKSMHLLEFLTNRQVDGFILAPSGSCEDQIDFLKNHNIPFVLIDRYLPETDINYVVVANFEAAYEATERLIHTGNKKIGMIAYGTEFHHMKERVRGYETALAEHGLKRAPNWLREINLSNVQYEVEKALDDMLQEDQKVDALFFATNTLAIKGLKYLGELGLKIPTDIRVVSFDQGEAFDFFYCPLTYVQQPLVQMAEKAVDVLIAQIAEPNAPSQQVSLKVDLVVRNSCS